MVCHDTMTHRDQLLGSHFPATHDTPDTHISHTATAQEISVGTVSQLANNTEARKQSLRVWGHKFNHKLHSFGGWETEHGEDVFTTLVRVVIRFSPMVIVILAKLDDFHFLSHHKPFDVLKTSFTTRGYRGCLKKL